MDCRTALEILEVVRPDSDDLKDPELASAAEHVGSCAQCEASFRSRQELDRRIGRLMRDVPVPLGLKEQLLRQLRVEDQEPNDRKTEADDQQSDAPLSNLASRPSLVRRRWFGVAASSAICLVAAFVVWQVAFQHEAAAFSVADLQDSQSVRAAAAELILRPDELPDFDDNFAAGPPASWSSARLSVDGQAKGFQPEGRDRRMLALYAFRLQTRRTGRVRGVVLVVPTKRLTDPPPATSFGMAAAPRYVTVAGTSCASAAWTEGGLVFVVFVDAKAFEALKDVLRVSPV